MTSFVGRAIIATSIGTQLESALSSQAEIDESTKRIKKIVAEDDAYRAGVRKSWKVLMINGVETRTAASVVEGEAQVQSGQHEILLEVPRMTIEDIKEAIEEMRGGRDDSDVAVGPHVIDASVIQADAARREAQARGAKSGDGLSTLTHLLAISKDIRRLRKAAEAKPQQEGSSSQETHEPAANTANSGEHGTERDALPPAIKKKTEIYCPSQMPKIQPFRERCKDAVGCALKQARPIEEAEQTSIREAAAETALTLQDAIRENLEADRLPGARELSECGSKFFRDIYTAVLRLVMQDEGAPVVVSDGLAHISEV